MAPLGRCCTLGRSFRPQRALSFRHQTPVRVCCSGGKPSDINSSKKSQISSDGSKRVGWQWVLGVSALPWVQSAFYSCLAADFVSETEPVVDVNAILLGDLVMLFLAPLFIYAALKMMVWTEEEENMSKDETPSAPLDPLLAAHVRSVVKSEGPKSNYRSKLTNPELRELADKTVVNISSAVKDAKETCAFQSSLHNLAVSHGGANVDNSWIDQVLQRAVDEVRNDTDLAAQLACEASRNNGGLCETMTRTIAERTALHELKELVQKLENFKTS